MKYSVDTSRLMKSAYWKNQFDLPAEPILKRKSYPSKKEGQGSVSITMPLTQYDKVHQLSTQFEATIEQLFIAALATYFGRTENRLDLTFGVEVEFSIQPKGTAITLMPIRIAFDTHQKVKELIAKVVEQQNTDRTYYPINDENNGNGLFSKVTTQDRFFDISFGSRACKEDLLFDEKQRAHYSSAINDLPMEIIWLENKSGNRNAELVVNFQQTYFEEKEVRLLIDRILLILNQFYTYKDRPVSELELIPEQEKEQLLVGFNQYAQSTWTEATIIDLIEEQAQLTPENTAVIMADQQIAYGELNQRANQLANYLVESGVEVGTLVAICMNRSIDMIVSLLAILKAGGTYVPIDPQYPASRIQYILEDAGAHWILSDEKSIGILEEHTDIQRFLVDQDWALVESQSKRSPKVAIDLERLAYIIYTSGSTGKPKGVMISHGNAAAFLHWCRTEFSDSDFELVYAVTSICFDLSIFEIFYTLSVGKQIRLLNNALDIGRFLNQDASILINTVPSVIAQLLDDRVDWSNVTVINMAGEPIPQHVVDRLDLERIEARNLYGPSEDTTYSTVYRLSKEQPILIGKPIADTQAYILGEDLELLPIGSIGELCLSGKNLSKGYYNRPELTSQRFAHNPFSEADDRLYRTGDLARWLPDGNIEFLGRADSQVKLRGFRIELGEIETTLEQMSKISQCVVLVKTANTGNQLLVGYYTTNEDCSQEEMEAFLASRLPEYMIPNLFVKMESFPLTPNGKTDKKALPEPDLSNLSKEAYVAPKTATEQQLAIVWQRLLGIEKIGIHDRFFDLGGHSLLATRLATALSKTFNLEISINDIFSFPSIHQLASFILEHNQENVIPSIGQQQRPAHLPLSYAQERLWFVDQMEGSVQYHMPMVYRVTGNLVVEHIEQAYQTIVDRHEILRTCIIEKDEQFYQQIMPKQSWKLNYEENKEGKDLHAIIENAVNIPFDLSSDHMLRVHLVKLAENDYLIIEVTHHIASDGWSQSIVAEELQEIYQAKLENREIQLKPLSVQYADYALWQRAYLEGKVLEKKLNYWEHQLAKLQPLNLPTDFQRPAVQSTRGNTLTFKIEAKLTQQLFQLSRQEEVTPFMTLLTAFKVLLYRYSGQTDICVGTGIANRRDIEIEGLIGFFVNNLAIRSSLERDPIFTKLLAQVKKTTLEAYAYQDAPFEKVVARVERERDRSRSPIFQVAFVMQNTPDIPALHLGEAELLPFHYENNTCRHDLIFFLAETKEGIEVKIEYNTDLFRPETIQRMMEHYVMLLSSIALDPLKRINKLVMLTEGEVRQLLIDFNKTQNDYPLHQTIPELFENKAASQAEQTAICFKDQSISYRELNEKANQLAHYLRSKGVREESLIGLYFERSIDMVIGLLGILKAGAAYVPIDPDYPKERIDFILKDTALDLLVTQQSLTERFDQEQTLEWIALDTDSWQVGQPVTKPHTVLGPRNLCYIIYTSGSTGLPKGVMIEHRSAANMALHHIDNFDITDNDRVLQFTSLSFDVSFCEIFMCLLAGARLVLVDKSTISDGEAFINYLEQQEVSVAGLPAAFLNIIELNRLSFLRAIMTGGEVANVSRAAYCASFSRFFNAYGPTECTVASSIYEVRSEDAGCKQIPIGKPIANTEIYILDNNLQLLPPFAEGEICIGGIGLARGYLNRDYQTSKKFIPHPFKKGERLYRTGDRGKWLPDGNVDFLGRVDDQVKIRGHRVELGEIEIVLQQSDLVNQCVVLAKEDANGTNQLMAYVVPAEQYSKRGIIRYLKSMIPDYMVPRIFIEMEILPRNANDKIDKTALPEPSAAQLVSNEYVAPRNVIERKLVNIWKQLLPVQWIGVYDNFFELGGHSLLATRVGAMIRKQFHKELAIKTLFDNPTVAALADAIKRANTQIEWSPLVVQKKGTQTPLSFSQERLWFTDQLEGSTHYHMPVLFRFKGTIVFEALEQSFRDILERHQILKTIYREERGKAYQRVIDDRQWTLSRYQSLAGTTEEQRQAALNDLVNQPFDLSTDFMLRAGLIPLEEDEQILLITTHHIASDGWSMSVFMNELIACYQARINQTAPELQAVEIQYADYAIWQKDNLAGDILENKLQYWEQKLAGITPLDMPTDFTRPAIQSTRGDIQYFEIDKELTTQLRELAKEEGVTLFMLLLTAFKVLLNRYTGQTDICIGSTIANRTQAEVESMIGFFVNTIALRSDLSKNPRFNILLQDVKATTLDAYTHQDVPFEKIVDRVEVSRDLSRSSIFQIMFESRNTPDVPELRLGEVQLAPEAYEYRIAKFDLTFDLLEANDCLTFGVEFCTDLFSLQSIQQLFYHYNQLLKSIALAPNQPIEEISILSKEEADMILGKIPTAAGEWFNSTAKDLQNTMPINVCFEKVAEQAANQLAIIHRNDCWTYRQLNDRANQLAHSLSDAGVEAGSLVGVYLERTPQLIAALLGIIKAGAVYVPLDTQNPADRIEAMIADSEITHLITRSNLLEKLDATCLQTILLLDNQRASFTEGTQTLKSFKEISLASIENPINCNELTSWAYVLYTSGSTGKPKGAITRHNGAMNHILAEFKALELKDGFRFLQSAGIGSDISVWQMLAPLLKFGAVVMIDKLDLLDFDQTVKLLNRHEVALAEFVPSYTWKLLEYLKTSASSVDLPTLEWIMLSGEEAPVKLVNEWKRLFPQVRILNGYGPCEASDDISQYEIIEPLPEHTIRVPIGRPIDNMNIVILDKNDALCPIGIAGELCVSGIGVGAGYWKMPEKTAKSFIPNPFEELMGDTLYRTGDLAKWLPDGNLVFLGRIDRQVKIRGHRIELGEIEALLREQDTVREAHVIVLNTEDQGELLTAFIIVASEDENLPHSQLQELHQQAEQQMIKAAKSGLPDYMQPVRYCFISEMPLNLSDKVDELALQKIFENYTFDFILDFGHQECQTDTEKALLQIWANLLNRSGIGRNEDFFKLGGHSLLAMRVKADIANELGIAIEIKDLFIYKTIEELAERLDQQLGQQTQVPKIEVQSRDQRLPLSFGQERIWFIHKFDGSTHYHSPEVYQVKGKMNREYLEYALRTIIDRHEVLRTVLREEEGEAYQTFLPADQWQMTFTDLSAEVQPTDLDAFIEREVSRPFDLSADYMLRAHLIQHAEEEFTFVLTIHHIATDGWSDLVFINELKECYEAAQESRLPALEPLVVQYADYATWQRTYLNESDLTPKLEYWKDKLEGVEPLNLPLDYLSPSIQSMEGDVVECNLDSTVAEALETMAKREGVTLYVLMLAAFKVLMYKYSGQEDICVGTNVANRGQKEIESLIGFFVNSLALRDQITKDQPFSDFVQQVKSTVLEAYTHQEVPFEKVVDYAVKGRDLSRSPLFQVVFDLHSAIDTTNIELGGLQLEAKAFNYKLAQFDLCVNASKTKKGLGLNVQYGSRLFKKTTAQRLLQHYCELLQSIVQEPNQTIRSINILPEQEKDILLGKTVGTNGKWFNAPALDLNNDQPINVRFEQMTAAYPNAIAVIHGEEQWTYEQLNTTANQIAHTLTEMGLGKEDFVGVYLDRDPYLVAALMGIMKCGAVYVPLDTQNPVERIEKMMENSGVAGVVTSNSYMEGLQELADAKVLLLEPCELTLRKQYEEKGIALRDINDIYEADQHNPENVNEMRSWAYMLYTSGSTGQPKGAITRYDGAMNHILAEFEALELKDGFRFLQSASIGSDISVWQMIAPILKGGAVVIIDKFDLLDYETLIQVLESTQVNLVEFVPSYFRGMIDYLRTQNDRPALSHLEWVMFSGEAVSVQLVNDSKVLYPGIRLLNAYGPCEASDDITQFEITQVLSEDTPRVPIGLPISNMHIFVLDEENRLCPIGIPGELCVSGIGVGAGYWNLPERTALSFVDNPFADTLGDTLYRTGDLARRLEDGNLDFLGRIDRQVKIRGNRIELGEIEAFFQSFAEVQQVHVMAHKDVEDNAVLLAFVVLSAEADEEEIASLFKDRASDGLVSYMQPQQYVFIDRMPLNLSDKVDEKALIKQLDALPLEQGTTKTLVECQTETEQRLLAIWQRLLKVEAISADDDFFEIGGHSLLAMRVKAAIRKTFEIEIEIRDLFFHKTIQKLGALLDTQTKGSALPRITVQDQSGLVPTSFAQERLWFIDQFQGSTQYHVQGLLRLPVDTNIEALEYALRTVIDRHQILRTVVKEEDGKTYQEVLAIDEWELGYHPEEVIEQREELEALLNEIIDQAFDLSSDYMLRAQLINLGEAGYELVIVMHHIASDGWSIDLFISELKELYSSFVEQRPAQLPKLDIQYADYALWQRNFIEGELLSKQLDYWKSQLSNVAPLNLPTDFKRPEVQSTRGGIRELTLSNALCDQLKAFSNAEEVTLYMTLLSAFKILLYRYSGQEDICVGTPIAGRTQEETENIIGFFVNMLALRSNLSNNPTFKDLVQEVKTTTLAAYSNQHVPFEQIVDAVTHSRDMSRSPIFEVTFGLDNTSTGLSSASSAEDTFQFEYDTIEEKTALFDLDIDLVETEAGLELSFQYCSDLFMVETIDRMMQHYVQLLESIANNPEQRIDELEMLLAEERALILGQAPTQHGNWFNQGAIDLGNNRPINVCFEDCASQHPQRTAIVHGNHEWTYNQLHTFSNRIGGLLKQSGIGKGDFVGICHERSPELIASILGIMKCGAIYVPLDTQNPTDRLEKMIETSQMKGLITNWSQFKTLRKTIASNIILLDELPEEETIEEYATELIGDRKTIAQSSSRNLTNINELEDWAYMMYTSGSTGQPKGAITRHDGAMNHMLLEFEAMELTDGFRFLQSAGIGSDISLWQMIAPLLKGGAVVIIDKFDLLDYETLIQTIETNRVNLVEFVPSFFRGMVDYLRLRDRQPSFDDLQWVMFSGEAVSVQLVNDSKALYPEIRLLNAYGPCEASDDIAQYEVVEQLGAQMARVPIGRSVQNMNIVILDKSGRLCPIGVAGELCVSGVGVGAGYWGMPEKTAAAFVPNPFEELLGDTLYRTGDLARWLPDGNLDFLGRIDRQVKIRGNRIELGEIEAFFQSFAEVQQVHVMAHKDVEDNAILLAFVVLSVESDGEEIASLFKDRASDGLVSYMQPQQYVFIDQMPLNLSDKVDEKALIKQLDALPLEQGTTKTLVECQTETEQQLLAIWQRLLKVEAISTDDDFFEVGGHSLLAMRVKAAIRKTFEIEIEIRDLFFHKTIQKLGALLDTQTKGSALPRITVQDKSGLVPTSFAQERLWFIDQFQGSTQYHVQGLLRLPVDTNIEALEYALRTVIDRHQILRTVVKEEDGKTYQEVLAIDEWELGYHPEEVVEGRKELEVWLNEIIDQAFDLSSDYMLRAQLINLGEAGYELVIVMHHIASDGWSIDLFISELKELYSSFVGQRPAQLPKLDIQYADYALWQRNFIEGELLSKQLDYWKSQLSNVAPLNLPTDFKRPEVQSTRGGIRELTLSNALFDQLKAFSNAEEVTLYMTLLSAFKILLYRYSGQEDICVGTPIAGRTQEETENIIGFFVNMLALRSDLSNNPTFRDLVQEVKTTTLAAYSNQHVPFEQIVDAVTHSRDMSRSPIFEVTFGLDNTSTGLSSASSAEDTFQFEYDTIEEKTALFDLDVDLVETEAGLELSFQYCSDLFMAQTIDRMMQHYVQLLESIANNPEQRIDELEMLLAEERALILGQAPTQHGDWFNQGAIDLGNNRPINVCFEDCASQHPQRTAIIHGNHEWTYNQLHTFSNRIGGLLKQSGIGKGDFVGICHERSPELIASILGIMKCGAIYVPLDTQNPADRLEKMIETSQMKGLITNWSQFKTLRKAIAGNIILLDDLPEEEMIEEYATELIGDRKTIAQSSSRNLANVNELDDWAYMMYTSGSTGQPKGAITCHDGAMNHILLEFEAMELADGFRFLQSAGIGSDISLWQMIAPLLKGGAVVIIDKFDLLDYETLIQTIETNRVNLVEFVPSFFRGMVDYLRLRDRQPSFDDLQWVMFSGEAVSVQLVNDSKALYPEIRLLNAYGPCEASDDIAQYEVVEQLGAQMARVPIGRSVQNMNIVILDKSGRLCPIGVAGELCVSGVGVGAGYWGIPEKTAAAFVPNPFEELLGDTLYRTGDLARWLPDGNLDFLGRKDGQIKIRGNRVETGEIENILVQDEAVKAAHVLVHQTREQEELLIAFVVRNPEEAKEQNGQPGAGKCTYLQALTDHLLIVCQDQLPAYMQPTDFFYVEELPRNLSDKINSRALIELFENTERGSYGDNRVIVEPRNWIEQALVEIWTNLLDLKEVSINDNFFNVGGHSLKAIQLASAIYKALNYKLTIREIFSHPTIATEAALIKGMQQTSYQAIPKVEAQHYYPASNAQKRLWVITQLDEELIAYNTFGALKIVGQLQVDRLKSAIAKVVDRHEILRTTFVEIDGAPMQKINDLKELGVLLEVQDYRDRLISEEQLVLELKERSEEVIDIENGPLFRYVLYQLPDQTYYLYVLMHHIICDGWSNNIFLNEVLGLYNRMEENEEAGFEQDLAIQYKDFASWQIAQTESEAFNAHRAFWLETFSGDIPVLNFPTFKERPKEQTYNGQTIDHLFSLEQLNFLKQCGEKVGASLFMTITALLKVLFYKYTAQEDMVFGVATSGRVHPDLEDQIGYYINTVALRNQLNPEESFSEFLSRVRQNTLQAFEHEEYPYDLLIQELDYQRDLSRNPLFDVLLTLQNMDENEASVVSTHWGQMQASMVELIEETSLFDMDFSFTEEEKGLLLSFTYNSDIYEAGQMQTMIERLSRLIDTLQTQSTTKLKTISLLEEKEYKKLVEDFGQNPFDDPAEETLVSLFEKQAEEYPDQEALIFEKTSLTYRQLDERANQLAHYLLEQGLQPNELVAICLNRSIEMIVGILGILKAGGAYVPLDPSYPQARVDHILKDSEARIVLTSSMTDSLGDAPDQLFNDHQALQLVRLNQESLLRQYPSSKVAFKVDADQLAYLIYTSGSTGIPKGVEIQHRAIVNEIAYLFQFFGLDNQERILQSGNFVFDLSVEQIFNALLHGGTLVLVNKETLMNSQLLEAIIDEQRITHLHVTPSMLQTLTARAYTALKVVISGGEACSLDLAKSWSKHVRFYNMYGPTEASIISTGFLFNEVKDPEHLLRMPIGRPVGNFQLYVVDPGFNPVPIGVIGELYVGGKGLAKGYRNRPELTAEKFIVSPFNKEERLYRTGDLVRWTKEGILEFYGRMDNQVKINGQRIEIGGVEAKLRQLSVVKDAIVVAMNDQNDKKYLSGFVVVAEGPQLSVAEVKALLAKDIPGYMIPRVIKLLDAIPVTTNGKADKKALMAMLDHGPIDDVVPHEAPRSEVEQLLAKAWMKILKLKQVSILDNFYDHGGDSITAIQVASMLYKSGYKIDVKYIMQYGTIKELAPYVQVLKRIADQKAVNGYLPMTPIQKGFFEQRLSAAHHFNQDIVISSTERFDEVALQQTLTRLIELHDILRGRFEFENEEVSALIDLPEEAINLEIYDLQTATDAKAQMDKLANQLQASMDLEQGPLYKLALFRLPDTDDLLITVHHLLVDEVSWRIFLDDFTSFYQKAKKGEAIEMPLKTDSYKYWAEKLLEYTYSEQFKTDTKFWETTAIDEADRIPYDNEIPGTRTPLKDFTNTNFKLSSTQTHALLTESNQAFNTSINDLLLTALGRATQEVFGINRLQLSMESHGRVDLDNSVNIERTMGWFTSVYPVLLDLSFKDDLSKQVKVIKEHLHHIPNNGISYGILKYLLNKEAFKSMSTPQIVFNYLGQADDHTEGDGAIDYQIYNGLGQTESIENQPKYPLEITAVAQNGELIVELSYDTHRFKATTAEQWMKAYQLALTELIDYCTAREERELTPSDFDYKDLSIDDLEELETLFG